MKNDFCKAKFCSSGYLLRRFRKALLICVVSLCLVFIHYFMKDYWTERFLYSGRRNVMDGVKSGNMSIYPSPNSSTKYAGVARSRLSQSLVPISNPSTRRYALSKKTLHLYETQAMALWLTEFTPGLPFNLATILQNILTRDFEKMNTTLRDSRYVARCKKGFFRLKGMKNCRKWLECSEVNLLKRGSTSGNGVGKIVHVSKWNGQEVAIVSLRPDRSKYKMFVTRVESGVRHMMMVQPSPYATQVVGVCNRGNNTILVLEFCKKGTFANFYISRDFRRLSTEERLKFAIQMIASFDYLHQGLRLPRVHCDLHTVMQAFGQWVVSEDLRLFLSDLDELPIVDEKKKIPATCEREPFGKMEMAAFLAPEARYSPREFDEELPLKPLDQNADVWKFPDLFANIMNKSPGKLRLETLASLDIDYHFKTELESIHNRCKNHEPSKRPSSRVVLIEYLRLYDREFVSGKLHLGIVA